MVRKYDELLNRIGSRIRERRKELGLTQKELGGSAYTKSYVSQVEKAQTSPSLEALVYFAERLQCPIEWFVAENPVYKPPIPPLIEIARELGMKPAQVRAVLEAVLRTSTTEAESP